MIKNVHALDASGSMEADDVYKAFDYIKSVMEPDDVVMLFDHRIVQIMKATEVDQFDPSRCGGGTLFQEVMDWSRDNGAENVIVYTDGWLTEGNLALHKIPTSMVLFGDRTRKEPMPTIPIIGKIP